MRAQIRAGMRVKVEKRTRGARGKVKNGKQISRRTSAAILSTRRTDLSVWI